MIFDFDLFILVIWGIVELVNVYIMASVFLNLEKKKPSINRVGMGIVLYLSEMLAVAIAMKNGNKLLFSILYIPFLLKSLFIISSFFKVRVKTAFIVFFFVIISSTLGSNIGIVIKAMGLQNMSNRAYKCEFIASVLMCCLFLLLTFLKKRLSVNIVFANLDYIDYILFIIITYSVSLIETAMFKSSKYSNVARAVSVIAYVSVALLIFRSIVILVGKRHLEEINKILENQFKQTTEYYNELVEKEKATKKFRHDIRNLLIGLYSLISENQNEKALGYIDELQEMSNRGTSSYNSGNFIADAIITAKAHRGEKSDIKIVLEGMLPSHKVADSDMVIIMSNLLDNAIEACEKLVGEKTISITSVLRNKMWVLIIANPSEEVKIKYSYSIPTSKEEKDFHGFGISNVDKVARKYNGILSLDYNEGIFQSKVQLMLD